MLIKSVGLLAAALPLSLAGVAPRNATKPTVTPAAQEEQQDEGRFRIMGPVAELPKAPGTITTGCTWYIDNYGQETCSGLPEWWGITMEDFVKWNPSVGSDCKGFTSGYSYCVEALGEPPVTAVPSTTAPSSTSSRPASTTSSAGNGIATPEPIQPGIVDNCNAFHKVVSGNTCSTIASKYGVTVKQLTTWNTEIGTNCEFVWLDYFICVGVVGTNPNPPASTTTKPSNGVQTPEPTQPGMVENCKTFHKVVSGNTCASIASKYGVTVAQLSTWNTEIGSTCQFMWLDYYICVGVLGTEPTKSTTTSSSTTTKPSNGIQTPEAAQPGMVGNCDAFHKVTSGDTCAAIASKYGVSVPQLTSWNTEIGSSCQFMWLDYYICVSIVGVDPKPTTTSKPSNGIATPTPTQPGMVGNCDAFHKVASGDTCATLASKYGVSVTQLTSWNTEIGSNCQLMWLDYYICVSIVGVDPKPTTTRPGNGVATPTPTQAGMTGNCKTFYKIQSGDTCATVAKRAGVSVSTFISWNTGVGSSCNLLWLDTWYCIGLI